MTVRLWDQQGKPSDEAKPAFWEKSIAQSEWQRQWIGSHIVGGLKTEVPVPFVRKSFDLPPEKKIAWARLYATALGLYEFHLNGRKVGDHVFPPFWTDYRERVQYQVHDVTAFLHPVRKTSPGRSSAMGGTAATPATFGSASSTAIAQPACANRHPLHRRLDTGHRHRRIVVHRHRANPRQRSAHGGKLRCPTGDARLEHPRICCRRTLVAGEGVRAPKCEIVAMTGPPVREIRQIKPIAQTLKQHWGWKGAIFDLGQNMVGRVRLKIKGPAGTIVVLKFAEVLDKDGNLYTANLRSARQTDSTPCAATRTVKSMSRASPFTASATSNSAAIPRTTSDSITGIVLHSDMEQTGSFECSDKLVNQLQRNIEWGQRGNFLDVPTDCRSAISARLDRRCPGVRAHGSVQF